MAGPVFRANGARATSAGAATIAPAKPTVDGQNGVLLAVVTSKNNATHATGTAGWSLVGSQTNSGAGFTASLWIAAESAGAPTFTWTGSVACSAQISYYSDPANSMNIGVSVSGATGAGTTATHTSTAFTTDAANSLAVYVDVAAANTAIATPAGWTEDVDNGSATDAGRTAFGNKAIASSGASSGSISVTGANAAWVQFLVELRGSTPTAGLEVSKASLAAWAEPPAGLDVSKASLAAWVETNDLRFAKAELIAWLDSTGSTRRRRSIING
jgi:hypothetical protein